VDEGLSPERKKTLLGRYILLCMKVFADKPPVNLLPEGAEDLTVDWVYQGTFWVMQYKKKSQAEFLDKSHNLMAQ